MREYGGVNPHDIGQVTNPRIVDSADVECPNCKCPKVFIVSVEIDRSDISPHADAMARILTGGSSGKFKGTYSGCAACPWASPMAMVAVGSPKGFSGEFGDGS